MWETCGISDKIDQWVADGCIYDETYTKGDGGILHKCGYMCTYVEPPSKTNRMGIRNLR